MDLPVMFAVMLILTVPALLKGRLSRWQGVLMLCIYAAFCRAGTVRMSMTANITGRSMTSEELMPAMVAFYSRFYSAFSTFLALG